VGKTIQMTLKNVGLRSSAYALASCLVLSAVPLAVQAAGLGRLVVLSPLGQPLRAEIEVSATREELADMKAQLASPESYKQAGVEYATTLLSVRFNLDKRPNGQSIIRLSSDKPINDPFIDMLLELNWPAGRLVREYTFLLDPPEVTAKALAPVAPATAKPVAVSKAAGAKPAADDETRAKAIAQVASQSGSKKAADQPTEGSADTHQVKSGETLRKIASETKPDGVSLEQMLVGLLRANQEAFDSGNMNRMKAGRILSVPEKSAIEAVSPEEAKKIVVTQSSDWNAYRSKLAGVAAQSSVKEDTAKQESSGKITAKVEDNATPAVEPKDQLKVSKTEAANKKAGKKGEQTTKAGEEELVAKEKALKEATERQVILEKNVADLNKLLEMKNQQLADLQKQANAKPAPAEVSKPVQPVAEAKPAVPPVAPAAVPAPEKIEPPVAVAETPADKPAEVKAPEPVASPEPAKPEPAAAPAPAPKAAETPKPPVVTPPPEEPGFVAELLDNPLALPVAGGGILALIAAYFVSRRRRGGKSEVPLDLSSTLTPQSSMTGNSVFRSTGGQSVDTSNAPAHTDFSQAGPGSIDTDEVDPVAEADVYMAYGRDTQAEEILVEAKLKDPKRYAIHLKLLEIYSNRKDLKQFEALATELYSETGGVGADWEKAAAMGVKLDPGNPLFGSTGTAAPSAFDADATVIVSSASMKNTVTMPGELSKLAASAIAAQVAQAAPVADKSPTPAVSAATELTSLDFDLGLNTDPEFVDLNERPSVEETYKLPEPVLGSSSVDFDLADNKPTVSAPGVPAMQATIGGSEFAGLLDSTPVKPKPVFEQAPADLDFDLGFEPQTSSLASTVVQPSAESLLAGAPVDDDVEFDVSLTESTFLGRSMPEPTPFDMYSIDLDLKQPELAIPEPAPVLAVQEPVVADDVESTEFDSALVSTSVNPDFGTAQAETVVNPQFGAEQDLLPEFDISENEEVATKLDLAKAYEEMGDLEGARELLNEVLKEGDATQKGKAQAILGKIGA